MFSKACEYAIKSMIYIEANGVACQRISLQEIAEGIDSPVAYTAKILQQLKKSGLIISTIGPKGGFQIDKRKNITVKNIVMAIDGNGFFNKCVLGLKVCSSTNPCPAHKVYTRIKDSLIKDLLDLDLADFSKKIKNKSIALK
jgi:Rrf2 family iron-sulfur cluster assembly transcriptional regulator